MLSTLFTYLKHELELLELYSDLTEMHQEALIKFDIKSLENIVKQQLNCTVKLRQIEEKRIKLMMTWLSIPMKDAVKIRLSSIEKHCKGLDLVKIKKFKEDINKVVTEIHTNNSTNRVLANRARSSVQQILSVFTNGMNYVCNVKI